MYEYAQGGLATTIWSAVRALIHNDETAMRDDQANYAVMLLGERTFSPLLTARKREIAEDLLVL